MKNCISGRAAAKFLKTNVEIDENLLICIEMLGNFHHFGENLQLSRICQANSGFCQVFSEICQLFGAKKVVTVVTVKKNYAVKSTERDIPGYRQQTSMAVFSCFEEALHIGVGYSAKSPPEDGQKRAKRQLF